MTKTPYTIILFKNLPPFSQKLFFLGCFLCLFFSANATIYTLLGVGTGGGCTWSNPAHWSAGVYPTTLVEGDSVIINYVGAPPFADLDVNFSIPGGVKMILKPGKKLRLNLSGKKLTLLLGSNLVLEQNAEILLNSAAILENNGSIDPKIGATTTKLTITGGIYFGTGNLTASKINLSNGGNMLIQTGAQMSVDSNFLMSNDALGTIFTLNGVLNLATLFSPSIEDPGTIRGSGVWNGPFSFTTGGFIAPGNSPGILSATNGFNQGGAELVMEINGTMPGTDHDQLVVTGGGDTISADSKLKLVFGADAAVNDTFNIITSTGGFVGTFLAANIALVRTGTNVGDVEITYFANKIQVKILSIVLPVELVDFSAKNMENRSVELRWQTASETNNRGFEIQFSSNFSQNDWETIGFIVGNGTTTDKNDYQFTHKNAPTGQLFYRLRQLDFDGKSEFSPVHSVKILTKSTAQFEPSIVENGETTLHFLEEMPKQNGLLRLFSSEGKLVFEQILEAENAQIAVQLFGLSSGIFTAQLIFENEKPQILRLMVK